MLLLSALQTDTDPALPTDSHYYLKIEMRFCTPVEILSEAFNYIRLVYISCSSSRFTFNKWPYCRLYYKTEVFSIIAVCPVIIQVFLHPTPLLFHQDVFTFNCSVAQSQVCQGASGNCNRKYFLSMRDCVLCVLLYFSG